MNGCDVLRAALQLSYAYEGEPPQVNQYCPRVCASAAVSAAILALARRALVLERVPVRTAARSRGGGSGPGG